MTSTGKHACMCVFVVALAHALCAGTGAGMRGSVALVSELDVAGFGASGLRLGDLNGDGRLDIVLAQNQGQSITCLTAIDIDGNMLWQVGRPAQENHHTRFDLPVQIYDFDGDGTNEVLCVMGDMLTILNGRNGVIEREVPLPANDARDCIIIANFSGQAHPRELVLKNRYEKVWALDNDLNILWSHEGNTGHYPWPYDFDGDGHDELMCGYTLLHHDGTVRWEVDLPGHSDAVAIGNVDGDAAGTKEIALACCMGSVFVLLSEQGEIIWRRPCRHSQHIILGDFRPDLPGLEVCALDRGNNRSATGVDAMIIYSAEGKRLWGEIRKDRGWNRWLTIITKVAHWDDHPGDLILAYRRGGSTVPALYDGHGQRVAEFPFPNPEAAHRALPADICGDDREEIVIWNENLIRIYENAAISRSNVPFSRPQTKRLYNTTNYTGMP